MKKALKRVDDDIVFDIMQRMSKTEKQLEKMRTNLSNWRIDDLKSIADRLGIEWVHEGGSHAVFRSPDGSHVSVPAARPIKPIYIKNFLRLVDLLETEEDKL
jgi:predicted RNA binding protein YcfA (HicA-like mRNA interferase family)